MRPTPNRIAADRTARRRVARKFCPESGILSAAGLAPMATAALLRSLLKPLAIVMLVGTASFAARRLLVGAVPFSPLSLAALVIVVLCMLILSSPRVLTMRWLRGIELVLFATVGIDALLLFHQSILRQRSAGLALSQWNLTALTFVLLMATYAIFVPNSWRRTALVIAPIALAPFMLGVELWLRHPDMRGLVSQTVTSIRVVDVAMMLLIAFVVCVLGTRLINRFRSASFAAHEAGLYDLCERIGSGGMGEVWRAEHQALARPAAIKLIRPELLDGGGDPDRARVATRRFEREAQATAALRSPNTIEIYDFGVTGGGVFFYVMEYLDGVDLETLVLEHGPLPIARAIYLLRQVCASLADAHANGLIHRDVKPANIFACRLGQELDFVKVLDFGLVKQQQRRGQSRLTMEGLTTGTPAYMAPEMALNDRPVGPATDVYAVGCVAYWLVTGKLVFERETPMATIVDHVKTAPVPPSERTEMPIPSQLDAVILKALAKDPRDRFASMRELSAALARVPQRGGGWSSDGAEDWWQLHRPEPPLESLPKAC